MGAVALTRQWLPATDAFSLLALVMVGVAAYGLASINEIRSLINELKGRGGSPVPA